MAEYGLLGAKLSHSYSKDIHNMLGYDYDLIECQEHNLDQVLHDKNYKGFNITVPYKEVVISKLDVVDQSVKRIGACNTIVKNDGLLHGYNTDYYGLKGTIESLGIELKNKSALILGSGGTSKTAVCVCQDMGATTTVVSRNGNINYSNVYNLCANVNIIINTTPYGMSPNISSSPLIDLKRFDSLIAIVDVVFNPFKTALISQGESMGIKTANGLKMLVIQAVRASNIFKDNAMVADIELIEKRLRDKYSNIVLIGMPGCGKTTIANKLAQRLGRQHFDSDAMIEQLASNTCKDIILTSGEDVFRQLETQVIKTLAVKKNAVISTGGGAVKLDENRYYLACNAKIVYIKRHLDKLAQDGRPLSANCQALQKLYDERKGIYTALADIAVSNNGDVNSLDCVVEEIIGALNYENFGD